MSTHRKPLFDPIYVSTYNGLCPWCGDIEMHPGDGHRTVREVTNWHSIKECKRCSGWYAFIMGANPGNVVKNHVSAMLSDDEVDGDDDEGGGCLGCGGPC